MGVILFHISNNLLQKRANAVIMVCLISEMTIVSDVIFLCVKRQMNMNFSFGDPHYRAMAAGPFWAKVNGQTFEPPLPHIKHLRYTCKKARRA